MSCFAKPEDRTCCGYDSPVWHGCPLFSLPARPGSLPEGGTAGEIQLAIAIDGEVVPTSIATATPTAVEAYWNVNGFAIIDVPAGCCYTVSVENASVSATPATTPAPALNLRNLNVEVTRLA